MPVCLYSLSQFPLSSRLGMQIHVLYWINWISSDNRHPCSLGVSSKFQFPVPEEKENWNSVQLPKGRVNLRNCLITRPTSDSSAEVAQRQRADITDSSLPSDCRRPCSTLLRTTDDSDMPVPSTSPKTHYQATESSIPSLRKTPSMAAGSDRFLVTSRVWLKVSDLKWKPGMVDSVQGNEVSRTRAQKLSTCSLLTAY